VPAPGDRRGDFRSHTFFLDDLTRQSGSFNSVAGLAASLLIQVPNVVRPSSLPAAPAKGGLA